MKTKQEFEFIVESRNLDLFKTLTDDEKDIVVLMAKQLRYNLLWTTRSLKISEEKKLNEISRLLKVLTKEYYQQEANGNI